MSQGSMKTIEAYYAAANRADVPALAELFTEDVVVDMTEAIGPVNQVFRGREAAEAMWLEMAEQWAESTWESENATELPPDTVVTASRVRSRGRVSGVEVDARVGQLWRFDEDGRIAYVKMFQSEAEALAAARATR